MSNSGMVMIKKNSVNMTLVRENYSMLYIVKIHCSEMKCICNNIENKSLDHCILGAIFKRQ